jgi:NTP pyrophosphatase (non-canonical NTP hydrolase)
LKVRLVPASRDVAGLQQRVREFALARDWERFHTPKNLAMALVAEAGELVEQFQWLTPDESTSLREEQRRAVEDEVADVLIYLVRLADVLGIDILSAAAAKIERNEARFPPLDA